MITMQVNLDSRNIYDKVREMSSQYLRQANGGVAPKTTPHRLSPRVMLGVDVSIMKPQSNSSSAASSRHVSPVLPRSGVTSSRTSIQGSDRSTSPPPLSSGSRSGKVSSRIEVRYDGKSTSNLIDCHDGDKMRGGGHCHGYMVTSWLEITLKCMSKGRDILNQKAVAGMYVLTE